MSPPPARPWSGSPYRRRRILWITALVFVAVFYLVYTNTPASSSPSPLLSYILSYFPSGSSSHGSSRVEVVSNALADSRLLKPKREIDALLHFIVSHPERTLGTTAEVQGRIVSVNFEEGDVDARVYAPDGDYDWDGHVKVLREEAPLVVFSKSYCPCVHDSISLI